MYLVIFSLCFSLNLNLKHLVAHFKDEEYTFLKIKRCRWHIRTFSHFHNFSSVSLTYFKKDKWCDFQKGKSKISYNYFNLNINSKCFSLVKLIFLKLMIFKDPEIKTFTRCTLYQVKWCMKASIAFF